MPRLILHCGLHKTGTTSLQTVMRDAAGRLPAHGVLYPRAGRLDQLGGGHHNLAWELRQDRRFRREAGTLADLAAEVAGFEGDVVLSSEDFENALDDPARFRPLLELPELAGRRAVFAVYVRDQASYLESLAHQKLLHGFGEAFDALLEEVTRHGQVARHEWRYQFDYRRMADRLDRLGPALGRPIEVRVRNYHAFGHRALLADFLGLLAPALAEELAGDDPGANQRLGPEPSLRMFIANRIEAKLDDWHTQAIALLCQGLRRDAARASPQTRAALAEAFRAGNMALCRARGLPAAGLDLPPRPPAPGDVAIERLFSFATQRQVADLAGMLSRAEPRAAVDALVARTRQSWWLGEPERPGAATLARFVSLGDTGEFDGLLRRAGHAPPDLFRLRPVGLPALLRALDEGFAAMARPERLEFEVAPDQRVLARLRDYDLLVDTGTQVDDLLPGELREQAGGRLAAQAAGLLARLRDPATIAVRKGVDSQARAQIGPLLAALRRIGRATLLWVTREDADHPSGTVVVIEPGFLKGFVERFAMDPEAGDSSADWLLVCRNAEHLARVLAPAGTVRRGPALPAPALAARATRGHVLKTLRSPAFSAPHPVVHNRQLIPAPVAAAMAPAWYKGTFDERLVTIRLLEDVVVVDDALVFTPALDLVPGTGRHHEPERLEAGRAAVERALADGLAPRPGTHALCKRRGVGNYGHWLMEMFPIAVTAQRHVGDPELRFIVPRVPPPLGAAIDAAMLGIGAQGGRVTHHGGLPLRVERLVLVEGLTDHGAYMSPLAVEAVGTLAWDVRPGADRLLYVTRESASTRRFADPAEVAALARENGYTPFDPGRAGLYAQIAAFAGARRIVGVMGAGLANIVFAPTDAEVTVLAPAEMPDTFFWFIAALRGLRHTEIRCLPEGPAEGMLPYDRTLAFPRAQAGLAFPPLD